MKPKVGTMSLQDVCTAFREAGIRTSPDTIANGIIDGYYPFGRLIKAGPNGNRRFEILAKDVSDWLASKATAWEPEDGEANIP